MCGGGKHMASRAEFQKANGLLNTTKGADGGRIAVFDVLDLCKISLDWWRHHKAWILHRYPQLTISKMEGLEYLIYEGERN